MDLRTLIPLDTETIYESVKKCNKVIILHEDTLTCGFGAELSALISEHCFEDLDAPILRVASMDTPIPFNKKLEDQFMPNEELAEAVEKILKY